MCKCDIKDIPPTIEHYLNNPDHVVACLMAGYNNDSPDPVF